MLRLSAVVASVLLPLLLAAGPSTRPATTVPTSLPGLTEQMLMAAEYATLPRRPARPIGALLEFKIDENFLRVSGLDLGNDIWATTITGWPGLAQVNVIGGRGLHFQHFTFDKNGRAAFATHVQVHTDYVQIARDYEDERPNVQLIQSRQFAENDNPVRLTVNGPNEAGPNDRVDLKFEAATFTALCREQPVAVRTYLLPIFRDLGAAAVLRAGDLPAAYQVLSADLPANAALATRVDAALARLADADAAVRVKAEEELTALGPAGAAELRRRDRSAFSPDVQATVDTVIRTAEPLDAETAITLGRDVPFLLDALTLNDDAITAAALVRIKSLTGETADLPPGLLPAERDRRINALSAKLQPTTQPSRTPTP